MESFSASEKLLVEEIVQAAHNLKVAIKSLSIGELIKLIRTQLGMSQTILAKRAGVPQSTVSRIEKGQRDVSLSTLQKILHAMTSDLVIAPVLLESIDTIRRRQARKIAEKRVHYLKGTMNLEEQEPDSRFIKELLQQEEDRLLHGPNARLWEE